MERHLGLLFLYKRKTVAIADLDRVQLVVVVRGPPPLRAVQREEGKRSRRDMYMLTVVEKSGVRHRLELFRGGKYDELERIGRRVAEFCGIAFVAEEAS